MIIFFYFDDEQKKKKSGEQMMNWTKLVFGYNQKKIVITIILFSIGKLTKM